MESRISQILGCLRSIRPGQRERIQETFVRIADPEARLGSEPVELAQPLGGGVKPRVIEDFRLVCFGAGRFGQMPFVAVPLPKTLIAFTARDEPETDGFIGELE